VNEQDKNLELSGPTKEKKSICNSLLKDKRLGRGGFMEKSEETMFREPGRGTKDGGSKGKRREKRVDIEFKKGVRGKNLEATHSGKTEKKR